MLAMISVFGVVWLAMAEKKWLSKNMQLILEYLEVTKPPELPTTRDILSILYPGQKIDRNKLSSVLRTLKNLRERGLVEKVPKKTVWKLVERPKRLERH